MPNLEDLVRYKEKMIEKGDVWEVIALDLGFIPDKYYSAKEKMFIANGTVSVCGSHEII